jgi:hypothetical protein
MPPILAPSHPRLDWVGARKFFRIMSFSRHDAEVMNRLVEAILIVVKLSRRLNLINTCGTAELSNYVNRDRHVTYQQEGTLSR